MSEYSREQISALMDGELDNESKTILQALISSNEHRQTWAHYHLIGECLRGNLPKFFDPDIADRIKTAIKNEPTILAPRHTANFIKPIMGFAMAASVAVIVVLGVQQTSTKPATIPTRTIASNQPDLSSHQLVTNVAVQSATQQVKQLPAAMPADARSRLNRYLVNYNEYRANAGIQGILPYVRIVAYETDEQE